MVVVARALVSIVLLFIVLLSSFPIDVPIAELRIFQPSLRNSSACGTPHDAIATPAVCRFTCMAVREKLDCATIDYA